MPQKCSGCGAEIPEGSKLGACPKCLLSVGLDAGGGNTPVSDGVKFESFGDCAAAWVSYTRPGRRASIDWSR